MNAPSPDIVYLTQPQQVSMGDAWFEIATIDHFWIRRRFEVLRKLTEDIPWDTLPLAEVGCGSGLLQRQVEDAFGTTVDGFDLNDLALRSSVAQRSPRFCYDVFERRAELKEKYGAIFLFDVIEHLDDDMAFLDAVLFHVQSAGMVFINVPADPGLFSEYDEAAGHVRRYLSSDLCQLAEKCGCEVLKWTYWGLPLRLLLRLRKRRLAGQRDKDAILRDGFSPRHGLVNRLLMLFSRLERIPQRRAGSSTMLIAKKVQVIG
jgi:SAM-dependent methyltransferase